MSQIIGRPVLLSRILTTVMRKFTCCRVSLCSNKWGRKRLMCCLISKYYLQDLQGRPVWKVAKELLLSQALYHGVTQVLQNDCPNCFMVCNVLQSVGSLFSRHARHYKLCCYASIQCPFQWRNQKVEKLQNHFVNPEREASCIFLFPLPWHCSKSP